VNVHASILPRYRGAAPIEAALLAGDAVTGVTIMRITEQMDAGPILLQSEISIARDETQASLKLKLAELGAEAMLEALARIARGEIRELAQDESQVSYCRPVKKEDSIIDWRLDARRIEAMTRAYDPWPIARTKLGGQELLIFRAEVAEGALAQDEPGTIVSLDPNPAAQCGEGRLVLLEVQAPGRKRMAAADFMRGRRIGKGQRLG
jgi:methionyl-tRNA formyltransferase